MNKAFKAALWLILFLCAVPLLFLILTDKIQEKWDPGRRPYELNLRTGCFEQKNPRVTVRLKELECLTPEERQAMRNPAASQAASSESGGAERILESARAKVLKAQELYQNRADEHDASRAARLETLKNPVSTFVKRVSALFR